MNALKNIRIKKGITHNEMAMQLKISKPYYWQLENKKRGLSYKMAVKIANVFNAKPDEIFYEEYKNKD